MVQTLQLQLNVLNTKLSKNKGVKSDSPVERGVVCHDWVGYQPCCSSIRRLVRKIHTLKNEHARREPLVFPDVSGTAD